MRRPLPPYDERAWIPSHIRWRVRVRAQGQCESCLVAGPTELHHLTYYWPGALGQYLFKNPGDTHWGYRLVGSDCVIRVCGEVGEFIFGQETEGDLLALCRRCHQSAHTGPQGEFIVDPEECVLAWDRAIAADVERRTGEWVMVGYA